MCSGLSHGVGSVEGKPRAPSCLIQARSPILPAKYMASRRWRGSDSIYHECPGVVGMRGSVLYRVPWVRIGYPSRPACDHARHVCDIIPAD